MDTTWKSDHSSNCQRLGINVLATTSVFFILVYSGKLSPLLSRVIALHPAVPQILYVSSAFFHLSTTLDQAHRHLWKGKQNKSGEEKKFFNYFAAHLNTTLP